MDENDLRSILGAVTKLNETQQSIVQALKTIAAERTDSIAWLNEHASAIKTLTDSQNKIAIFAGEIAKQHGEILKALNERISALEIKALARPSEGDAPPPAGSASIN